MLIYPYIDSTKIDRFYQSVYLLSSYVSSVSVCLCWEMIKGRKDWKSLLRWSCWKRRREKKQKKAENTISFLDCLFLLQTLWSTLKSAFTRSDFEKEEPKRLCTFSTFCLPSPLLGSSCFFYSSIFFIFFLFWCLSRTLQFLSLSLFFPPFFCSQQRK